MVIEQNDLIDPCGVARPPRYRLAERREGPDERALVVLPHPTNSLLGPDAEARAKDAVSEVVRIITENARSLAEAYAAKEYAAPKRAFRAKQVFK